VIHRPQDVLSRTTCEPERKGAAVRRQAQVRIEWEWMDDSEVFRVVFYLRGRRWFRHIFQLRAKLGWGGVMIGGS